MPGFTKDLLRYSELSFKKIKKVLSLLDTVAKRQKEIIEKQKRIEEKLDKILEDGVKLNSNEYDIEY